MTTGTFHGIGLGPGDPELVTMRAVRLIAATPVLAWFAKAGRRGHARTIVDSWMKPGVAELPLYYPVTTEIHYENDDYIAALSGFYADSTALIATRLEAGEDVALVCEGDPLFYGSFMHLFIRLKDRFPVTITPGITGMAGCWAAAGAPMTWGDDVMTILPGTLDEPALTRRLAETDAAVIMKIGSNFNKVRAAITAAGCLDRAIYVERGTMEKQKVERLADKADDATAPYFSLILIPGNGRRP